MLNSKLILGTVQFGTDYGISNKNGKISKEEVFKILNYALDNNINMLDTSYLYGDSESVIGSFVKQEEKSLNIISKLPSIDTNTQKYFYESLNHLNITKMYAYLIHHFDFFKNNENIWSSLIKLKNEDKIDKIGFSLYYPEELEYILNKNILPDIIQVPYNIFDQRFEKYFTLCKEKNIEIHIRSIFLQGLFFLKPTTISDKFLKIKDKLVFIKEISDKYNISISSLCLNFCLQNNFIDRIIIGIESFDNFQNNINTKNIKFGFDDFLNLKNLKEEDEKIILPFNWSK